MTQLWQPDDGLTDVTSSFIGFAQPLHELIEDIHRRGWTVSKLHIKADQYVAVGKNPHKETLEATGRTEATAAANLLVKIMRREFMRGSAVRRKLGAWDAYPIEQQFSAIAQAYAAAPVYEAKAAPAWMDLAQDCARRAQTIRTQVTVEYTADPVPYENADELREDVQKKRHIMVTRASAAHPVWSEQQMLDYRLVVDVLGHVVAGGDWGWHGTCMAFAQLAPLLADGPQKALYTELLGQAAFGTFYRRWGPQKVCFLDKEIERLQEKENKPGHTGVHPSQSIVPSPLPSIFTKVGSMTRTQLFKRKQELDDRWPDRSEAVHEFPDGWTVRRPRSFSDIHRWGELMGNCWSLNHDAHSDMCQHPAWPMSGSGDPVDDISMVRNHHPDNYKALWDTLDHPTEGGNWRVLADSDGLPRANWYDVLSAGSLVAEPTGRHNTQVKPEYRPYINQYAAAQGHPNVVYDDPYGYGQGDDNTDWGGDRTAASGTTDPNANWESGVNPLPDAAYLWQRDENGVDPLNAQALTDSLRPLECGITRMHPQMLKQSVINALRSSLLGTRNNEMGHAVHYQDLAHIPADVDDPMAYRDALEQRREQWNQSRGYAPGSHKQYWPEEQQLKQWVKASNPHLDDGDVHRVAQQELYHMLTEEEERILAQDEGEQLPAEVVEHEAYEAIRKRLKAMTKPTVDQKVDFGEDHLWHEAATNLPGPGDEGILPLGDGVYNYCYINEDGSVTIAEWRSWPEGRGQSIQALIKLHELYPGARIEVLDARGALSYWQAMKQRGLVDDILNEEGGRIGKTATHHADMYPAYLTSRLRPIAQISRHADELADAARQDLLTHRGHGHHFRAAALNLGIPGLGPRQASHAWLHLAPQTSQLGIIDPVIAEALGHDYASETTNRDYFRHERELQAGRDSAGYQHVPLGAFSSGLWDLAAAGPGWHPDRTPFKAHAPTPYHTIDWPSQQTPAFPGLGDPYWWKSTQEARDGVAQDFDRTVAVNHGRDEVPFQKTATREGWFAPSYGVPDPVRRQIHQWVQSVPWPEGTRLKDPAQYHITSFYSPEGYQDSANHQWLSQFVDQGFPAATHSLESLASSKPATGLSPVVLRFHAPELAAHAQQLADLAEARGLQPSRHPSGYKPHITVADAPSLPNATPPPLNFTTEPLHELHSAYDVLKQATAANEPKIVFHDEIDPTNMLGNAQGYWGRWPTTYDPDSDTVHVGPEGSMHSQVMNALDDPHKALLSRWTGWIGPNPESDSGLAPTERQIGSTNIGWYNGSPGPHIDYALATRQWPRHPSSDADDPNQGYGHAPRLASEDYIEGHDGDWGGPGENYMPQAQPPGEKPIYIEMPYRNSFTGEEATYRGPVMKIIPFTKRGEQLHSLVINPMTTITARPGDYTIIPTDDLQSAPEVGPDQPEHFARMAMRWDDQGNLEPTYQLRPGEVAWRPWLTHPQTGQRITGSPGTSIMQHVMTTLGHQDPREVWAQDYEVGKGGPGTIGRTAMAERTGNPELDSAIAQFMLTHHEVLGDIQDFRHPMVAWGRCEEVAEACAAFLKSKGFDAYASSDDLDAFGYQGVQPSESVMTPHGPAGEFTYPAHCAVGVYNEHGVLWWTIDFTASQYGLMDEFPKVEPGPPGPLIGPQLPDPGTIAKVAMGTWGPDGAPVTDPIETAYHTASKDVRHLIEAQGLRAGGDPEVDPQPAVFMTPRHPQHSTDPHFWNPDRDDVYEVDVRGLPLFHDPWGAEHEAFGDSPYLQDLGGSIYHPGDIGPERVKRLEFGTPTTTAKVAASPPEWLYHHSPLENADSIRSKGLQAHYDQGYGDRPGIYLTTNPQADPGAVSYAVNVAGLPIEVDPTGKPTEPGHSWYVSYGDIEPHRVHRAPRRYQNGYPTTSSPTVPPRWQPGQPLYHVTNHPDAETTGLDPRGDLQPGVHMSPDFQSHIDSGYGRYVYEIDTRGLPLKESEHWDEAYYSPERIPPERIRRIASIARGTSWATEPGPYIAQQVGGEWEPEAGES